MPASQRCLALQHGPDETQSKAECHHHSQPDSSPRQRCRGPLCSKDWLIKDDAYDVQPNLLPLVWKGFEIRSVAVSTPKGWTWGWPMKYKKKLLHCFNHYFIRSKLEVNYTWLHIVLRESLWAFHIWGWSSSLTRSAASGKHTCTFCGVSQTSVHGAGLSKVGPATHPAAKAKVGPVPSYTCGRTWRASNLRRANTLPMYVASLLCFLPPSSSSLYFFNSFSSKMESR